MAAAGGADDVVLAARAAVPVVAAKADEAKRAIKEIIEMENCILMVHGDVINTSRT